MKKFALSIALSSVLSIAARAQQGEQPDFGKLMNALNAMNASATNAGAVAVVDFRELKTLLPTAVGAMKRTEAKGEKQSSFGIVVSTAEGEYSDGQDQNIRIKISDFGGNSGMVAMMHFGWAAVEIDKETDDGYEKTTTVAGHKALEKYHTDGKSGELQIMVAQRFMVEIEGSGIEAATLKTAAGKIDLAKLAALQPKTAAK